MKENQSRTPVKLSVSPWKLELPGKVLTLCICFLPFLTFSLVAPATEAVRDAYFLGTSALGDFEQLCREWGLLAIAAGAVLWFLYERLSLQPRRRIPMGRGTAVVFLALAGYLVLGLLSSLCSSYTAETWMGIYLLYEGYLALVGYVILFAAAWYWIDRAAVLQFAQNCLTGLAIVLGILALFEKSGICYYNNALVKFFSGLDGTVSLDEAVRLTFGNSDYLGMYSAMLLPLMVSLIFTTKTTKGRIIQIIAAAAMGMTLVLSQVMNAILFGFAVTAVYLLLWAWHTNWARTGKLLVTAASIAAVLFGGFGFLWTRTGDTLGEKLWNTCIGMEQADTFQLLSMKVEENTVSFTNADTTFSVTAASGGTLSLENLIFAQDGTEISPTSCGENLYQFSPAELAHCQVQILEDRLQILLGYSTPIETIWAGDSWQVVGIGGTILDSVPLVSDSATLQKCYSLFNGRVFVWANTIQAAKDCWLIGHGAATSIFYLNQNDLPALLNIFDCYVLYNKPHSWYLQMVQDTGVLSLVLVLAALVVFFVTGVKTCFGKGKQWKPFQTGLLCAIFAYCLTALLSDSTIYQAPMFWLLLGMGWRQFSDREFCV